MTPGRERGLAALLCAAGAGLTLLAGGRVWASVRAEGAMTALTQNLTGGDLGGAAGALGWAGLAGLAALFATRGRARVAVGALIALLGSGVVHASVTAVQRPDVLAAARARSALLAVGADPVVDVTPWWAVSAAGGVLLAAAGLVTAVRGHRWPGMSARYERAGPRPAAAAGTADAAHAHAKSSDQPGEEDASAMWKSLDRGEDPTARTDGRP
ncbi:MAG TPA: Trp biosynthesis-associated membrane protein [Spirillospora sp.]